MAIEIPTNTALYIAVGPFFDKTDGISPELSITVANSAITLIADAGSESAPTIVLDSVAGNDGTNTLTHITNDDAGMYYLKLTAANNNRYGSGKLIIEDVDTYVTVFHEIQWVSAQYYNMKYGTTILNANATQISGDSDAADNCELFFDGTGYAGGTTKLQVDLKSILATALTETSAGYLAAAFKKLFDVASPQLTVASKDQTGDSYAIVNGDHGLVSVQDDIDTLLTRIIGTLDSGTHKPQSGDAYAKVNDGTIGLANLKTLIDAIQADIGDASGSTLGSLYAILGNAAAALTGRIPAALESGNIPAVVKAQDNIDFGALQKASITAAVPTAATIKTALEAVGSHLALILEDTGTTLPGTLSTIAGYIDTEITSIINALAAIPTNPLLTNDARLNNLDAAISSRLAAAGYTAPDNTTIGTINTAIAHATYGLSALRTQIDLKANAATALTTSDIPTTAQIKTALEAAGGYLKLIKDVTDALTAAAAAKLAASAGTIESAAAVAGTLSTTEMTTDLTEATNDHYNGRIIIWTSGVLKNQATDITDYDGATKKLMFTAVTEAPSEADTFIIV